MTSPVALPTHAMIWLLGMLAVVTLSLVILLLARLTRTRHPSRLNHHITRMLDAFPSMIGYWDATLRNHFANRAYAQWFGIDQRLLPGMHIRDFYGDALFESIRPHVEAVLAGQTVIFEQTIPRDQTVAGYFLAHYVPDVVKGRVRGFYALKHDITQITASQRRLATLIRDNENLLRTLHRHAIVSVADANGRIIDANPAFCAISGYSRAELLGCDHRVMSSGTHSREFWRSLGHTLAKGNPWRGEICNRTKDGSLYWVDSIVTPFFDDSGQVVKLISICHDITAHKEAQEKLHDAINLAQNANHPKRALLANMSGEIRAPLSAIIGLGLLEETPLVLECSGDGLDSLACSPLETNEPRLPGTGSSGGHGMAPWLQLTSLDPSMLQQVYGQDAGLFTDLLARVLRDYADFDRPLSGLPHEHKAREAFRRRVRKLKGSASLLGAAPLLQCVQRLEKAMREDCEPADLQQRLAELSAAFCTLRAQAQPLMEHAAPVQSAYPADVIAPTALGSHSDDRQRLGLDIAHLCGLLDQNDLAAFESFDRLTQSWRDLQRGELNDAREAIEDLHFSLTSKRLRAVVYNQIERSQSVAMQ